MRKEYLKKLGCMALSAAMIVSAAVPAAASEPEQSEAATVWTLGKKENVNGPKDGVQGENGWYFLFTDEIDVAEGARYDISKFKECTWASKGSLQLTSEGGAYENMWVPDNYLKDGLTGNALVQPNGGNPNATFNNWVMTSNGTLNPNVETTAVTGIYAWQAPSDGDYNFEFSYEAGGDHCDLDGTRYYYITDYYIKDGTPDKKTPEQREGGVAVSVNTKDSKEKYVACAAKTKEHDFLYSGAFDGTVTMKAGERLYFAVDPREVGTYDMSNLAITVTTAGTCEWGEPEYTWDENNVCTATKHCSTHIGHTSSKSAEGVLVEGEPYTAPTCTAAGEGTFKASFEDESLTEQIAVRPIKMLGHTYDAWNDYWADDEHSLARIEWSEDYSKCTWKSKCKNCSEFGEIETTDKTTMKGITATCTEGGIYVYQASFYWGWLVVSTDEMTSEQGLGHDFSDIYSAEYDWTEDNTMCTKTYICSREGCEEKKDGEAVQTEITKPSCTKEGKAVASFDWGWDVQEKKIPAAGHDWGEWARESQATQSRAEVQKRVCKVCGEIEKREVGSPLPVKVNKITVSGISKKIAAGKTIQLKAAVKPSDAADKAVTWTSSNRKYATVSAKGNVKIKAAGKGKTVTIKATAKDGSGVAGSYKITIMRNAVKSISLKAKAASVKAGKKLTVKAAVKTTGKSSVNKKLQWTSSNTKYATVNSKGVVKTKAAGKGKKVTITATATDGSGRSGRIKIRMK